MASVSSTGIGSGLDISSIVSQLVAAEGSPVSTRLDKKEASYLAQLTAIGSFKGALSDFQNKLASLGGINSFQGRSASVTNATTTNAFTASASSIAQSGSYNIAIANTADAQTLVTDTAATFSNVTEAVGTGSLTFRFGTGPIGSFVQNPDKGVFTVDIDENNNSLKGVSEAINNANIGVRASIINNGDGYLLALSSTETGADNSMEITVSDLGDGDDSDALGLSQLAYNASATNLTQTTAAKDALLTIDGVSISSASNTVTDAVRGVTLNLLAAESGKLDVQIDKAGVTTAIDDFISGYNSLIQSVNTATAYNAETRVAGPLNGDANVRSVVNNLRNILSNVVDTNTVYTSLSGLGIRTGSDGTLSLDSAKLDTALTNNFDEVTKLFSVVGKPNDSLTNMVSFTEATQVGNYPVNIDTLASRGLLNGNATAALADDGAGNFTSAFVIDASNDTFKINVNGTQSQAISLTQNSYNTTAQLVDELQSRINSDTNFKARGIEVAVSFDSTNDRLIITSGLYGSTSAVSFLSEDTNTASSFGFSTTLTGTTGTDVAGTINGVAAIGKGRVLTAGATSSAEGLQIEIVGGLTGARGSIAFSRGIADQLHGYVKSLFDDDVITNKTDNVSSKIADINESRASLSRRLESLEARLLKQFTAMDILVSKFQSTGSFLEQQLNNLPQIGGSR